MSYAAIEVELRQGHLIARGSDPLPETGEGLLVIRSTGRQASSVVGSGAWQPALAGIRVRQAARGHSPRKIEDVVQQVDQERKSWD